jgi:mRNA interferase MazF
MPQTNHLRVVPNKGEIVICDFTPFAAPEMIKRRPCIVVSPVLKGRPKLCTIVPLSTTPPNPPQEYNVQIAISPVLRKPYDNPLAWVKADMLYTVSIDRIDRPSKFDQNGKRIYYPQTVNAEVMSMIENALLCGFDFIPF